MSKKSCLILTSEKSELDQYFQDVAERSLMKMEFGLLRLQKHAQLPGERVKGFVSITEQIEQASFLLVNITEHNADLMYQIGYAHALGKRTMFYVHEEANDNVPEFLAGYIYRVYSSPKELEHILGTDIKRYISSANYE